MHKVVKRIAVRQHHWNRHLAGLSAIGISQMPAWAQDVVGNAATGMSITAANIWAPRLSVIAIIVGVLGVMFAGGHAMKATIAGITLAVLLVINANNIVNWLQALS
jgi:hypothetical protein